MTNTETTDQVAQQTLESGRATVAPALRAAVDTLHEPMRRIAGYHFGWWDADGRASENGGGGKAIRPTLTLLSAAAVGGSPVAAVPAAVAVELTHNFSLLHDDVIDGDRTRRRHPTAWSVFGIGAAILAGSSLLTLAFDVLAASGHPAGMRTLAVAVQAIQDGQSADTAFENRMDVAVAECVQMAEDKTGALLGCACALGALFGGGTPDQVWRLRCFGEALGLAFQHTDDLLGIWGEPAVTGKPVFSDLRNRKKSLPVVAALHAAGRAGGELAELYRRGGELSADELAHAADLVDRAGGRAWSQARAGHLLAQALGQLSTDLAPRAVTELGALAHLIIHRDH